MRKGRRKRQMEVGEGNEWEWGRGGRRKEQPEKAVRVRFCISNLTELDMFLAETPGFIKCFPPVREVRNNEEKRTLKGGQTGRYLQPRIPMLSLALMWDSSSCRDTHNRLGDLFYLRANEYQVTATLTHLLPLFYSGYLIQAFILTHTLFSVSLRGAHTHLRWAWRHLYEIPSGPRSVYSGSHPTHLKYTHRLTLRKRNTTQ